MMYILGTLDPERKGEIVRRDVTRFIETMTGAYQDDLIEIRAADDASIKSAGST